MDLIFYVDHSLTHKLLGFKIEFVTLNVLCKFNVYLNLFDDVDHSLMHWLFVIYALFAESFTNNTHYSREVFIVCTKNHRVVSGKERGHEVNSVCLYNYAYIHVVHINISYYHCTQVITRTKLT